MAVTQSSAEQPALSNDSDSDGSEEPTDGTLAAFDPDAAFPPVETADAGTESEADAPATSDASGVDLPLSAHPVTIENPDALAALYDHYGQDFASIAAALPSDPSPDAVRDGLRRAHCIDPWDDPHVLDACYHGCGFSTTEIAERVCGGDVSAETVRQRMEAFGIERSRHQPHFKSLLDAADEQSDEKPEGDDTYQKFVARAPNA